MSKTKPVDLIHGDVAALEDLIDRESLNEICYSFYDLFGLSVRIFSNAGTLLADIHEERQICRRLNETVRGRMACINTVTAAQKVIPKANPYLHQCFTGAVYLIAPISYDDRQLGRAIIGPFLPAEMETTPITLEDIFNKEFQEPIEETVIDIPSVRKETSERIIKHLRTILDLILFSCHRSRLMSDMHLASVRESYKQLAEKNASLQEAYEELKELDRLKSNFLATISHELRTPLTSIIGYSEMLLSDIGGQLNLEQRSFADIIYQKGELLLKLITNLLDLNQFEQKRLSLNIRSVDPKEILKDVIKTLMPEALKKGVALESEYPIELHYLNADPLRLKQIMLNLVSNAIKFTATGGKVTLSAKSIEILQKEPQADKIGFSVTMASVRGIEFEIRDTGIGIAKDKLDLIFDAFYQVDGSSTREYSGIGLGLSIVKRLVEAHGGKIEVSSETSVGSVFSVRLPEQPPQLL